MVALKGLNCGLPWGVSSRVIKTKADLRRLFALESLAVTCQSFFPTCSEWGRGRAAGLRSAVHLQAFNLVVPVRWLPWQLMTAPSPPFKTWRARKEARVIHRHTANLYCDI